MKILISLVGIFSIFLTTLSFAEAGFYRKERPIKREIISLHNDYIQLNRELRELEADIRDFPATTLNFSVTKRIKNIQLVSVEISNKDGLIKSHIYTPLENEALEAGSRHQLYQAEVAAGSMILNVVAHWKEDNKVIRTTEAIITVFVTEGRDYFVELSLEKVKNKVGLLYSRLEFDRD